MYIIHYSLGFPPYRIGGMTKFCIDIMEYLLYTGNRTALLWPGRMTNGKIRIYHSKKAEIDSFEIINPLPVSICNGIRDDKDYTKNVETEVFEQFLEEQKPDCIHVHTLEGLPKEFLEVAKQRGIRLIYSTHDFFGICPTNDLYCEQGVCNVACVDCGNCNQNAFSLHKIKIMQSVPYRVLKNTLFMKYIRKKIRKDAKEVSKAKKSFVCDYFALKKYYKECFEMFDDIHCNSSVTYEVFSSFLGKEKLKIVNITNSVVVDKRIERKNEIKKQIRFLYLGVETVNKGFYFLIDVLDKLRKERDDFKLVIYSQDNHISRDYIEKNGTYSYAQLGAIYKTADLLIVPSLRLETFGFVTLEAYYHGVPSLVLDTVGSKDILTNNITGFITSKQDFAMQIKEILDKKHIIYDVSENIKKSSLHLSMKKMVEEIYGEKFN